MSLATIRTFAHGERRYRHAIDLDTDEVLLQRLNPDAETPEDEWRSLLRYDRSCQVWNMAGSCIGSFRIRDSHWIYDPHVVTDGWQIVTCEHTRGAESLLDSEVTISKRWLAQQADSAITTYYTDRASGAHAAKAP